MARAFPDIDGSVGIATASTSNGSIGAAAGVYRDLTGVLPEAANIDDDASFDRHVLASILALASSESGRLEERAGLTEAELADVLAQFFTAPNISASCDGPAGTVDADEMETSATFFSPTAPARATAGGGSPL